MKMMRSTSTTSTSGVTLMPEMTSSSWVKPPATLLRQLSDQKALERLGLGERRFDSALKSIERNNGRNSDQNADRGRDERFGDARGHHSSAGIALLGEVVKRFNDA